VPTIRPSLLALAAVWAALALSASPALATVTTSNVTSPADGTILFADAASSDTYTVSGTSDGTVGDEVQIECYAGTSYNTLADHVAVDNSGNFTTDIPKSQLVQSGSVTPCIIRAVPEPPPPPPSAPPGSSSPFSGPKIQAEGFQEETIASGPNAGVVYDYYLQDGQSQGSYDYHSTGYCGLYDSYLWDPVTLSVYNELFYCNAGLHSANGNTGSTDPDSLQATASELKVDGNNAFLPGALSTNDPFGTGVDAQQLDGFPALSWTHSYASDDAVTITESQQPVRCAPSPVVYPPTTTTCTSLIPTGVRLDRTITQSHDGLVSTIRDKWTSVDGAPHQIGLQLQNDQNSENPIGYEFPWISSAFAPIHLGAVAGPSSGPGRIYVTSDVAAPSGSTTTPQGVIVFAGPPKDERVIYQQGGTGNGSGMELEYDRTVPANGSASLAFAYASALNRSDVTAMADQAQAAFTPSITINPLPASTTASSLTVTGRASFGDGLTGVTVNGASAALAGDGSWSATVPVKTGANAITATATTVYGGMAQATGSITGAVTSPKLRLSGRAKARGKYVVFHVSCAAAAGAVCHGRAVLSFKERLRGKRIVAFTAKKKAKLRTRTLRAGSKSFSVASGKLATVKVRLSRSAQKLLRHHRRLTVRLDVSLTGSGKAAKVASQKVTFKVKARKKKHHR
jgi:hypothetical protein